MKKFFKNATLLFLIVTAVISLVACGGGYSVDLGIGDGKKENDRVSVKFDIAETIYDRTFRHRSSESRLIQNSYLMKMAISGWTMSRKRRALEGVSAGR